MLPSSLQSIVRHTQVIAIDYEGEDPLVGEAEKESEARPTGVREIHVRPSPKFKLTCIGLAFVAMVGGALMLADEVGKGNHVNIFESDSDGKMAAIIRAEVGSCWGQLSGVAINEGKAVAERSWFTLDKCRAECNRNAECESFSFSPTYNTCFMKDRAMSDSEPSRVNQDFRTYYKQACMPVCWGSLEGVATNEGYSAGQLPGSSLVECQASCQSKSECESLSYSIEHKLCFLKSRVISESEPSKLNGDFKTYYKKACASAAETELDSSSTPAALGPAAGDTTPIMPETTAEPANEGVTADKLCWGSLEGVAINEGIAAGQLPGSSLDSCQASCQSKSECESLSYSVNYKLCFLKARAMSESEPSKLNGDFKTYYKKLCASPPAPPAPAPPSSSGPQQKTEDSFTAGTQLDTSVVLPDHGKGKGKGTGKSTTGDVATDITCWESLVGVATNEGSAVGESYGISLDDCEALCAAKPECGSVAYTSLHKRCFLKSQVLTKSAPSKFNGDFKSYFKVDCTPAPPTPAPDLSAAVNVTAISWNVHYQSRHYDGVAGLLVKKRPDIVGLNECTMNYDTLADVMNAKATGANYLQQPGVKGFQGYGTRIIFDGSRWIALEGGERTVHVRGTRGGNRAANWVVLKHRSTGRIIITGGTHLSYCQHGCQGTHEGELGYLYDILEKMQAKWGFPPVIWMGDLNRVDDTNIIRNLKKGKIGSDEVFAVEDLAQPHISHYYGGIIDWVFSEAEKFDRIDGGTLEGARWSKLHGSDHFPVFAELTMRPI